MQIIGLSIDFDKISKDDLVKGKYLNLTLTINDQKDKYDNDGSIIIAQSKEQREAKAVKRYVGNAKVLFSKDNSNPF
jgi:putative NADPH-quinone reductase